METFAAIMSRGGDAAVRHIGSFFMGTDPVHKTLHRVTRRLSELGIPHAVCGGMSLAAHGYVRSTTDVDILTTADGLRRIHEGLSGLGFVPPFKGSKNLCDAETKVKVEFLVSGGYPGDGKPKPVAFPDPDAVAEEIDGVRYLSLPALIDLKLASGMTAAHRGKDITDVDQLIEIVRLPRDYAEKLNPYVRDKFRERWDIMHGPRPDWEEPNV